MSNFRSGHPADRLELLAYGLVLFSKSSFISLITDYSALIPHGNLLASPHPLSPHVHPNLLTVPHPCATLLLSVKFCIFKETDILFLLSAVYIGNIFEILAQTGWVARGVLGILLFASLISWALIFQKSSLFGRIRRESDQFLRIFRATKGVANPQGLVSAGSPFANVYAAGYRELQSQVTGSGNPSPVRVKSVQAVTVTMQQAASEEVRRAEKGMSWLATTAGAAPFIGLFGTVWGIIDAFSGLGTTGSASLRAVAPGIAEALVTTAAGLFAAIPALIAYNYFLQDIRDLAQRLDTFALEFAAQIEKTFT